MKQWTLTTVELLVPPIKVTSGGYEQCADADVIVIAGGLPQKPGETRLDLVDKNMKVVKDMSEQIVASGFDGVIVIASNPVDVLTNALQKFTGSQETKSLDQELLLTLQDSVTS